ncbi:hypothetical protein BCR34DRAFT_463964, partial [Clohesyomyces aquaticus]
PKPPANMMPGGTAHTAGGTKPGNEMTYFQFVKTLGPEYYLEYYKTPCVRDSQLMGISALFAAMGVGAVLRKHPWTMANYGFISWLVVSCSSYQYCQNQRSRERRGMRMAKEMMEQKRKDIDARREAKRKAKEEQERLEEQRKLEEYQKSWSYWIKNHTKFW